MITGDQLRLMRQLRNFNQAGVANLIGIKQSTYCEWEQAEVIKGERLQKILKTLNFTLEEVEELKKFLPPR